jgi:hypothetical protein
MTRTRCFRNLIAGTSPTPKGALETLLQGRVWHGRDALEFFWFGNLIVGTNMTRTGYALETFYCRDAYVTGPNDLEIFLKGRVQNGRNSLESYVQTGCFRNTVFQGRVRYGRCPSIQGPWGRGWTSGLQGWTGPYEACFLHGFLRNLEYDKKFIRTFFYHCIENVSCLIWRISDIKHLPDFLSSTNYTFCVLQVDEVASSLASEDVFVLETTKKTWIWKGKVSFTSFYAGWDNAT